MGPDTERRMFREGLEVLWERAKTQTLMRVEVLEALSDTIEADGGHSSNAIVDACLNAHTLAGSLGMFGLPNASSAAREIEVGLQEGSLEVARLNELVTGLRMAVDGGPRWELLG